MPQKISRRTGSYPPASPHVDGQPSGRRRAGPRLVAGLAVAARGVEAPRFLAGLGIVRRDVAVVSLAARAARQHLAFDDNRAATSGCRSIFVSHRTAPVRASSATIKLSGDRAPCRTPCRRRSRAPSCARRADRPLVLPDRRRPSSHRAPGRWRPGGITIHHAVVARSECSPDCRSPNSFLNTSRSCATLLPRDLLQRAEPLRIVGPAVHQPVVRRRVHQHLRRHRLERARLLRVHRLER